MTNEEIVKNAPHWATHWAVNGELYEYSALIKGVHLDKQLYDKFVRCGEIKPCYGKLWQFTSLDELKTTESVYTQEMKDNGEPVKVGMKFKISSGECIVAAMVSLSNVAYETNRVIHTCLHSETYPIKSEREEAEEALIKKVTKVLRSPSFGTLDEHWYDTSAKKLLEAGLLAEIILPLKRS